MLDKEIYKKWLERWQNRAFSDAREIAWRLDNGDYLGAAKIEKEFNLAIERIEELKEKIND